MKPFWTFVEVALRKSNLHGKDGSAVQHVALCPSGWDRFTLLMYRVVDIADWGGKSSGSQCGCNHRMSEEHCDDVEMRLPELDAFLMGEDALMYFVLEHCRTSRYRASYRP